jgi:hypothetical protein
VEWLIVDETSSSKDEIGLPAEQKVAFVEAGPVEVAW